MAARLKQEGAHFPVEDSSSTSSGTSSSESGRKTRRRGKVRSGQKIKKRPVIKTELWPHTIANEEEGDSPGSLLRMPYTFKRPLMYLVPKFS